MFPDSFETEPLFCLFLWKKNWKKKRQKKAQVVEQINLLNEVKYQCHLLFANQIERFVKKTIFDTAKSIFLKNFGASLENVFLRLPA